MDPSLREIQNTYHSINQNKFDIVKELSLTCDICHNQSLAKYICANKGCLHDLFCEYCSSRTIDIRAGGGHTHRFLDIEKFVRYPIVAFSNDSSDLSGEIITQSGTLFQKIKSKAEKAKAILSENLDKVTEWIIKESSIIKAKFSTRMDEELNELKENVFGLQTVINSYKTDFDEVLSQTEDRQSFIKSYKQFLESSNDPSITLDKRISEIKDSLAQFPEINFDSLRALRSLFNERQRFNYNLLVKDRKFEACCNQLLTNEVLRNNLILTEQAIISEAFYIEKTLGTHYNEGDDEKKLIVNLEGRQLSMLICNNENKIDSKAIYSPAFNNKITDVLLLKQGKIVASISEDNVLSLWDGKTCKVLASEKIGASGLCICELSGNRLAVGDHLGKIHIYSYFDRNLKVENLSSVANCRERITSVASFIKFDTQQEYLIAGSSEGKIYKLDGTHASKLDCLDNVHKRGRINIMVFRGRLGGTAEEEHYVASVGDDEILKIILLEHKAIKFKFELQAHKSFMRAKIFDVFKGRFLLICNQRSIKFIDMEKGKETLLKMPEKEDKQSIFVSCKLWRQGILLASILRPQKQMRTLAFAITLLE